MFILPVVPLAMHYPKHISIELGMDGGIHVQSTFPEAAFIRQLD